jgi:hypothetical protein
MSYIFRLHKEGNNTLIDWDNSSKYGNAVIEQIEDPNGESSSHEITSIPSPFARIDLVKTAFAKVVEMAKKAKSLDGNTIHHKMVSDCFDVGQLFFEFDKHKDKLEIIVWDKENDLTALRNSDNPAHKQLAETYRIYLEQDGATYNFDKMDRMYLLNFTKDEFDTSEINIIGATSPATLFFTSANNLDYVTRNIQFGNDRPFDKLYCPLYKRDLGYLKYLWTLKASIDNFSRLFKEVDAYMTESFNLMDDKTKRTLRSITKDDLEKFVDIPVGGSSSHPVEVLKGVKLKQGIINPIPIEESGFTIDSDYKINGFKPLILPIDTYIHPTIYTHGNTWNKNTKVPYFICDDDGKPIQPEDRILPDEGSKYPFLTISDFLSDTIVRMPYEINKESFFDGNINRADGKCYLLPLTDLFFKFFSTEKLKSKLRDGSKMFELRSDAGGIIAILRVPIKDNKFIEYRRKYFEAIRPSIRNNDGGLVDHDFVFALFPNIRFNSEKEAFYRFGIIPDDFGSNHYGAIYSNSNQVNTGVYLRNENYNSYLQCKNFILENSNFDYLRITCPDGLSGVVIPNFTDCSGKNSGKEQYTFAIDFGTTNTHIEYSKGNQKSVAFDINEKDRQIHLMTQTGIGELKRQLFDFDFIPEKIRFENEFNFPTRTALSTATNYNFKNGALPFVQGNVAFPYEMRKNFDYNQIITGLKWTNGDEQQEQDNKNKVKCFIESLCMIIRNKVVLNNGNLSNTKIIWSYPVSMEGKRLELFEQIWQEAYRKYFGENIKNLLSITESVTPYIYYKDEDSAAADMVSIDIGGGTTDMVIVVKEQIKFITSFRFAANAVFGNGYAKNKMNGIVRQFYPVYEREIAEMGIRSIIEIKDEICKERDSSNIACFFFSLKNNQTIIEEDKKNNSKRSEQLDFQSMLSANTSHKIVFVIFYAAIIYHLANLIKSQKLDMPRHISFSGNGSKIIQILTRKSEVIEDFTKLIFEKVNSEDYSHKKLNIMQNENNPKEVTCKGAILYDPDEQNYNKINKLVLQGTDSQSIFSKEKYADINQEEFMNKCVEEAKQFLTLVLKILNDNPQYIKDFGIDYNSLEIVENESFSDDLKTFASKGLSNKLREINIRQPIEETFFFYPLVGLMNSLNDKIYNSLSKEN